MTLENELEGCEGRNREAKKCAATVVMVRMVMPRTEIDRVDYWSSIRVMT